jgi:ATP-dependent protease ClpP protease subunit
MKVDLDRLHNLADQARRVAEQQRSRETHRDALNRSWFRIENRPAAAAEEGKPAGPTTDIYLYDAIGEWGVTAQDFVNALRGVVTGTITMYVNCPGGEVFDGLAIYEAIRRHPANVTAFIDGIAASAASFIVQAADHIVMAEYSKMMIHDAHGFAMGNAGDMRSMADLLDNLSSTIADIYAERTGKTRDDWRAAMQAAEGGPDGTWYDAKAAVKAKLADEMIGGDKGDGPPAKNEAKINAMLDRAIAADVLIERALDAQWDAGAFLQTLDEVENPAPPVEIPAGPALFAGLFDR